MIIGHIPNSYVLFKLFKLEKKRLPLSLVLLGTLMPDIIDKSLHLLMTYPGRGVGHTLFFPLLTYFLFWKKMTKRRLAVAALALGHGFHLFQDTVSHHFLFWPFWGDFFHYPGKGITENLVMYYLHFFNPPLIMAEFISIVLALYFLIRENRSVFIKGYELKEEIE